MPTQQIPLGGGGRHAGLLVQSPSASVTVKDLRLRRVIPPAASLDSSPDKLRAAKPGSVSVDSTPPETGSAQDGDLKPMLPRSKLVRDPASFGYRRLLPFLNQMANHDNVAKKELRVSHFGLVDKPVTGSYSDSVDTLGSIALIVGQDQEMKDCVDIAKAENNTVPGDISSSKPWLTRCPRSRIVHHHSSFSYKRMLPFLMENELSSQESDRVKIRKVMEEKDDILANGQEHKAIEENHDVLANGQDHPAVPENSPEERNKSEVKTTEEEKQSKSDGDYVLDGEFQPVSEISHFKVSTVQMPKNRQEEVLTSDGGTLSSDMGAFTSDGHVDLASGQHQLSVSEDSPEESSKVEVERIGDVVKSDGISVLDGIQLQTVLSDVPAPEGGASEMQKATQNQALTPDGDEGNTLTSDKGEFFAKEVLKDNTELAEMQQFQSSESGYSDVAFASPTKTAMSSVQHSAPGHPDPVVSLDDPLLDMGMLCRFSDACTIGTPLSVEEMSGCIMHPESGSRKAGSPRPRGSPCLEKRGLSPTKHSPKKGILKRHTRGCKGICMCLDCSIFRLRADRAFEFSRKQMQEADDIIGSLLKEVATLRCLMEKSGGQESPAQAACWRALRVEQVAKERRQQMLMELNSHCRIPGPRVKFAEYVEEKMVMASSPRSGSGSRRR